MGKKRMRFMKRVVMMVLVFCMLVGVVSIAIPMEVKASTNGHTREEAVQWIKDRANEHWEINDGSGWTQCTEFIWEYYKYLGYERVSGDANHYLTDAYGARKSGWTRPDKSTVQPGDIVIWDKYTLFTTNPTLGGALEYGHIGLVVSVNGNSMVTAEANSYGAERGQVIYQYKREVSCISGLLRPDWPNTPPQGSEMSPDPNARTLSDGDYFIISALGGDRYNPGQFCLGAAAYGDNAQIGMTIGEPPSIYTVTWLGNGFYRIKNKNSDKYLDVTSMENGANVQHKWADDPDGTKNLAQQWRINETNDGNGGYTLQARRNSYYLDLEGGRLEGVDTNVQVGKENGRLSQRWFFIPWGGGNSAQREIQDGEYQIVPKHAPDKALNAAGNNETGWTGINLWSCIGGASQTFKVKWLGDGYYSIIHNNSGLALGVYEARSQNIADVALNNPISDSVNNIWLIKSCGDGYYSIISKCNGLYMEVYGKRTEDGAIVVVYTGNGGDNQKWKFEKYVAPSVDVESVILDQNTLTLKVDEVDSLTSTVYPENATDQTLTWTSSNPSVAEVVSYDVVNAVVTAKSAGTATITATSKNGKTATCEVTVQEKDLPPCEHVYGDDWQFDGEKHWKACNQCGEKIEEATHGFVQKSDENNHWKECLCGARAEESEHMFAWVVDQAATQDSTGLKHEECGTCGSKRSEGTVIEKLSPDHEHVYGSVWQSDGNNHWKECECGARTEEAPHELTQNSDATKHWKECACGKKIEESIHEFTWIIDRDATQENEGVKHEQCNTCGYIRSEGTVIEKLPTSSGDGNDGDGGQSGSTDGSTGGNTGGSQSGSSGGNSGGDQSSSGGNSGSQSGSSGDSSGGGQNNDLGYIFGTPEINTNNANAAAAPVVPAPIAQAPAVPEEQKPNQPAVKQETVKAPAQDDGKPFIKGADGKIGWEVIREEEEKAKQGSTINVDMGKTLVVPGNIFDSVKNKDVTLTFDMGNGILWSVGGKSVTADKAKDIDFNVKTGVNTIPAKLVNSVAGKNYSTQISIAHDGEFGFTAVLCINIGTKNKGLAAKLYYYNKDAEALEFVTKDTVTENGLVSFALSHASEYVIVVEAEEEDKKAESTEPESVETPDQTAETAAAMEESPETENPIKDSIKESPETAKSGSVAWLCIVGILVLAGAGMTVLQVWKKKKEQDC